MPHEVFALWGASGRTYTACGALSHFKMDGWVSCCLAWSQSSPAPSTDPNKENNIAFTSEIRSSSDNTKSLSDGHESGGYKSLKINSLRDYKPEIKKSPTEQFLFIFPPFNGIPWF